MTVQKSIIEGIKELLHHQDYVVIPGFGGFVAQMHVSRYLVEKNILTPPGKFISFNKQLKQNDGTLTLWLQSKLNLTSQQATLHLNEFSEYCRQVLQAKRRLNLDDLGFFYLDFENNICFEPNTEINYHTDSFGLASVILNELVTEKEVVPEIKTFEDRILPIEQTQKLHSIKRFLKPLAYVALGGSILFFTLSALIQLNQNNGPLWAGVITHNTARTYKPIAYTELSLQSTSQEISPLIANAEGIAVLKINDNPIAVKTSEITVTEEVTSTGKNQMAGGKYQIVLGCFSVHENAQGMVKKLQRKNIKAAINGTNKKGMHVVSCAGFSNKDEAQSYLHEIKNDFPTAWIKSSMP